MPDAIMMPKTVLKYDVEVLEAGRVELQGPFLPGEHVTIFVVKEFTDFSPDLK